jgi:hypothetical protein
MPPKATTQAQRRSQRSSTTELDQGGSRGGNGQEELSTDVQRRTMEAERARLDQHIQEQEELRALREEIEERQARLNSLIEKNRAGAPKANGTAQNSGSQNTVENAIIRPPDDEPEDYIGQKLPWEQLKQRLDLEKLMDVTLPMKYKGESYDKCQEWIDGWERVFQSKYWTYSRHSTRINNAVTGLDGDPAILWQQKKLEGDIKTWGKFKAWLFSLTEDPIQQKQKVATELKGFIIQPGEDVKSLYARMVKIERGIRRPEADRILTLDTALVKNRFRSAFLGYCRHSPPETAVEWLRIAIQAEADQGGPIGERKKEFDKGKDKEKDRSKDKRPRSPEESGEGNKGKRGGFKRPKRNNSKGMSPRDSAECYSCGEKGHYASDPKCPKYPEWKKANPEKAADLEKKREEVNKANKIYQVGLQEIRRGERDSGKGSTKS